MCQPEATPAGISVRTCTISQPGIDDGACWSSVRRSRPARPSAGALWDDMADLHDVGRGAVEQRDELVGDGFGLVLDEEVGRVEPAAAHLARPGAPDLEDVAVEAGEGAARAPHDEHRALDPASPAVGLVVLAV